jgi:type VI secretion system protein ImpE
MGARELLGEARLSEAIALLSEELRLDPADGQRRTFLFELLCFNGEFERALRHLEVLAAASPERRLGALAYAAAIRAEQERQRVLEQGAASEDSGPQREWSVLVNGHRFGSLRDADPRLGAKLEVIAGGDYLWVSFWHLRTVEIAPPRRLRDLRWVPARVRLAPEFGGQDLGEVLLPVVCVSSWRHPDERVRLGRVTVWEPNDRGEEIPYGQKMWLADDELIPLLEVRQLEILPPAGAPC